MCGARMPGKSLITIISILAAVLRCFTNNTFSLLIYCLTCKKWCTTMLSTNYGTGMLCMILLTAEGSDWAVQLTLYNIATMIFNSFTSHLVAGSLFVKNAVAYENISGTKQAMRSSLASLNTYRTSRTKVGLYWAPNYLITALKKPVSFWSLKNSCRIALVSTRMTSFYILLFRVLAISSLKSMSLTQLSSFWAPLLGSIFLISTKWLRTVFLSTITAKSWVPKSAY
jgi:hypothetical protein